MRISIAILNWFRVDRDTVRYGTAHALYMKMVRHGTVLVFLKLFLTICPRLTAVVGRCSQPTTAAPIYILPTSDCLSHTHITMQFVLFSSVNIFSYVMHTSDLLAAGGGLNIRVEENKHRRTTPPLKSSACPKP